MRVLIMRGDIVAHYAYKCQLDVSGRGHRTRLHRTRGHRTRGRARPVNRSCGLHHRADRGICINSIHVEAPDGDELDWVAQSVLSATRLTMLCLSYRYYFIHRSSLCYKVPVIYFL